MKKKWLNGLFHTLRNVIGNMFPLIGGVTLVWFFGKWAGLTEFYNQGEFYIYSTTFFVASIYIFHEKRPYSKIHYLPYVLVGLSVLFYSALKSAFINSEYFSVDPNALRISSFILLGISIVILFISYFIDAKSLDVYANEKKNLNDLDNEFKSI